LDQDSVPMPNMVETLISIFKNSPDNQRIGAVGPLLKDQHTQLSLPFFSYSSGRKKRIIPADGDETYDVEFLVSSGSLISMTALLEIGLMREELFISYVDVEWGLRARSFGYRILACCATCMDHNLGEQRIKIGQWLLPLHSPERHFYLLRSGIYLQKLRNISIAWKCADRRQLLRSFILFGIFGLPRLQELIYMCRGLIAGLRMPIQDIPSLTRRN